MKKFIKENWFKVGTLFVIALVSFAIIFFFLSYLPQNKKLAINQERITSCFTDGNKLLDNYKSNNGTNYIIDPIFHYNKSLNKCFAYATVAPYQSCESGRVLFDVYENKEFLTACFTNYNTINYVDSSKYPVEIIDQLKFSQRKNYLLELQ